MSIRARILIVAREDDRIGQLAEGLDRLGWRTITARGPYSAATAMNDLPIEAAIIDLADGPDALLLARRLKLASPGGRVPIIALGDPGPDLDSYGFDLVLPAPVYAAQAILRIETLVRLSIAEEEFDQRCDTFAARGVELKRPEQSSLPVQVLTIGEPVPRFLALTHALKTLNAEVVGAFTPYTAFDYLHEREFDSVVLWGGDDGSEALSIATGMRRNTRLFHMPALLYLERSSRITEPEAFAKGITDLASPDTPEIETARRIIELARNYRRLNAIRQSLLLARSSGLMDAATGLFTQDLFASHLLRLQDTARKSRRPLSVALLRISDSREVAAARRTGWLDRAIPQIGSMISHLVRVEDTAARLAPEVFALALPASTAFEARAAADRIAAVLACTAFDAGEDVPPFTLGFEIGTCEVQPDQGVAAALEAAARQSVRQHAV